MAPIKPGQPDSPRENSHDAQTPEGRSRFNVLITEDRDRPIEHWTRQIPRLLEPQGVSAFIAKSGREALDISTNLPIHAAIVDLATPRDAQKSSTTPTTTRSDGLWLLEVLNRQPNRPPVVVVNGRTYSARQAQRMLNEALRLGAFSVLNGPVHIEALLHTIRRLIEREYHGHWPKPACENTSPKDPTTQIESIETNPQPTTFKFTMKFKFQRKRPPEL